MHQVKGIEPKLIKWYYDNKCNQGDSYSVIITNKGRWKVSHSNDCPMQHGDGSSHIFSDEDFAAANMEWINVQEQLPTETGLYKIKTRYGEYEAFFTTTLNGDLVWVIPDSSIITHWKNK